MKRFLSISICAFIVILIIFTSPRISQTPAYAQLPLPLPSVPADLPNFSQFNISDVFKIVNDIIPDITGVINNGNLPTSLPNPASIINQLLTGQLSSVILSGTSLSTYVSQFAKNPSSDDVIPELLKNLSSQLPANALSTITTLNPQTGLFDVLGALTGNTTTVSDLLKFSPNTSYLVGNTKAVPNYSGAGCLRGNNLPNASEGTIGPMTFNSTQKYICQNGKWNLYVPTISPGVTISPQPQNPTMPSIIVTTRTVSLLPTTVTSLPTTSLPTTTQPSNPPTAQGGICTCTCSGSFKGCGPGPHNNGSWLNHLSCQEGTDSASGSESVASAGECTIDRCFTTLAPAYAKSYGQAIAEKQGGHLDYVNVTSCSSAVFTPNP